MQLLYLSQISIKSTILFLSLTGIIRTIGFIEKFGGKLVREA